MAAGCAAEKAGAQMTEQQRIWPGPADPRDWADAALAAQVKKMPRARRQRLNRVLQGWNVTGAEVEP